MRIMIRIQNYSKYHCNGKVIWESENETTLLPFYHLLPGTAHSQQRNHPQEQPHCTKGNNMIYCLILTILPFPKDILNCHIHIGHWEMISVHYWILTILNEPSHRFTSRPNSHIDEFQYNSIKQSRIERKHSSKQNSNLWIMERQITWSFKHHPVMP